MSEPTHVTNVEEKEVNIDDILGIPGSSSIMVAKEEEQKKPSVFSNPNVDTTFLDKFEDDPEPNDSSANPDPNIDSKKIDDVLAITDTVEDTSKKGRHTGLVTITKNLMEKGLILPFEGEDKDISEYKEKDIEELFELNIKNQEAVITARLTEELATEFLDSLPVEMQQAYAYISNGGKDLKGMFATLASSVEMQNLDVTKEEDQRAAIRAYLSATQWGTPDEIEDEILNLEDKHELEKKAKQFKPKLDAMQQQIVEQRILKQQDDQKKRQKQSQMYIDSVHGTLQKGELNGIKLDNKTQNMLYTGLVQSNYPSLSGKQTNMLGHLLEKYQWSEPRHDLIAEALWLLADPDGYRKTVSANISKEVVASTVRTLKNEQAGKGPSNSAVEDDTTTSRKPRTALPRPTKNFFAR